MNEYAAITIPQHQTKRLCENIGYYILYDKVLKDEDIANSCYLRADYLKVILK